jgi:hypothetical protein
MKFATLLRNVKNSQLSLDDSVKNLRFWVKNFFCLAGIGILGSLGEQTGEKQSFIEIARSE